ncbi:unnamed protein product [Lymnaea stagnalis]|uniref:Uncharacterized protein n=1 Tax=Lymnaea stagnalis TaxID=6523 RepID=A0AAV2ILX4_LYMST
MLRLVCVLSVVLACVGADINIPITHYANGWFQADGCFKVAQELTSWTVTLTFDQTITFFFAPEATLKQTLDNGKVYVLQNKTWNKVQPVGDQLCIRFEGRGTGASEPVVTGSLQPGS